MPNVRLKALIAERGWTRPQTADKVNAAYKAVTGRDGKYTEERIRKLVRGEVTWPQRPARRAFELTFRTDSESLGFFYRQAPDPAAIERSTVDEQEDDVRRIDFLRGLAAMGSATLAGGLGAAIDDVIAVSPMPRQIGREHVEDVERANILLRQADYAGMPLAREAMAAQMRYSIKLLDAPADRRTTIDLNTAVGALAETIGWAHFDSSYHRAADRYFRIGLHCADAAGAWWIRADILSDMARQAVYLGQPDEALTLLGAAKIREDRLSHLRRANLSAVQARAYAALGDVRECLRSVRDADEHFRDSADDRGEPDYASYADYFCDAQLSGDTGHALYGIAVRGNEIDQASDRLSSAIEDYPSEYARSRAFCLALLASLTLRHGDADEGVALGRATLEATRNVKSARLTDNIREIYDASSANHAGIRELRSSAAEMLAITGKGANVSK